MFDILSHKRNTIQNCIEIQSHPCRMAIIKEQKQTKYEWKKELIQIELPYKPAIQLWA
jgi:hypothetical protein